MILFDGHDLEQLCICGSPKLTFLDSGVEYHEASGVRGARVKSRKWETGSVSFAVCITGTAQQRREKLSTLGSWLDVDEAKKLVLPDTPGWHYLAIPDGALDMERLIGAETARLSFTLADPVAYGDSKAVTVPSGGSVSFTVGGTYPTRPVITAASAVRSSSSNVWGIRLDDGDVLYVATGSASARKVVADCEARTCKLAGATALPTLASDWLELSPGTHTLKNDQGSGACTIKYVERWL